MQSNQPSGRSRGHAREISNPFEDVPPLSGFNIAHLPIGRTRAYIRDVVPQVTESSLRSVMSRYGKVTYLEISRTKKCAFVEFGTFAAFQDAVHHNPHAVDGINLRVEPRRERNRSASSKNPNHRGTSKTHSRPRPPEHTKTPEESGASSPETPSTDTNKQDTPENQRHHSHQVVQQYGYPPNDFNSARRASLPHGSFNAQAAQSQCPRLASGSQQFATAPPVYGLPYGQNVQQRGPHHTGLPRLDMSSIQTLNQHLRGQVQGPSPHGYGGAGMAQLPTPISGESGVFPHELPTSSQTSLSGRSHMSVQHGYGGGSATQWSNFPPVVGQFGYGAGHMGQMQSSHLPADPNALRREPNTPLSGGFPGHIAGPQFPSGQTLEMKYLPTERLATSVPVADHQLSYSPPRDEADPMLFDENKENLVFDSARKSVHYPLTPLASPIDDVDKSVDGTDSDTPKQPTERRGAISGTPPRFEASGSRHVTFAAPGHHDIGHLGGGTNPQSFNTVGRLTPRAPSSLRRFSSVDQLDDTLVQNTPLSPVPALTLTEPTPSTGYAHPVAGIARPQESNEQEIHRRHALAHEERVRLAAMQTTNPFNSSNTRMGSSSTLSGTTHQATPGPSPRSTTFPAFLTPEYLAAASAWENNAEQSHPIPVRSFTEFLGHRVANPSAPSNEPSFPRAPLPFAQTYLSAQPSTRSRTPIVQAELAQRHHTRHTWISERGRSIGAAMRTFQAANDAYETTHSEASKQQLERAKAELEALTNLATVTRERREMFLPPGVHAMSEAGGDGGRENMLSGSMAVLERAVANLPAEYHVHRAE